MSKQQASISVNGLGIKTDFETNVNSNFKITNAKITNTKTKELGNDKFGVKVQLLMTIGMSTCLSDLGYDAMDEYYVNTLRELDDDQLEQVANSNASLQSSLRSIYGDDELTSETIRNMLEDRGGDVEEYLFDNDNYSSDDAMQIQVTLIGSVSKSQLAKMGTVQAELNEIEFSGQSVSSYIHSSFGSEFDDAAADYVKEFFNDDFISIEIGDDLRDNIVLIVNKQ